MIVVSHRRNTLEQLRATMPEYGVEIDIRSHGQRLILHHDPFTEGDDFEVWLRDYKHRLLILNVKEEGLEDRILELMREHRIDDYFFLDQSFPFLIRSLRRGETRCAVRISEYESIETALTLSGRAQWVWIDCFSRFPIDAAQAKRLRDAGYRLCAVSPELQGRDADEEIGMLRKFLGNEGIALDAVCTKCPEKWIS